MSLPWYLAALGAALTWGVHYPLIDHASRKISIPGLLVLTTWPLLLMIPLFWQQISQDIRVFRQLSFTEQLPILATSLTAVIGASLLYLSIQGKNATLASLIEITYPLFVPIFAYLLFRQMHINASVVLGGILIMLGAGIIIANNR